VATVGVDSGHVLSKALTAVVTATAARNRPIRLIVTVEVGEAKSLPAHARSELIRKWSSGPRGPATVDDLANADADNESGQARMRLEQPTIQRRLEQASPTIVDSTGWP
jgi:hypothetical protein